MNKANHNHSQKSPDLVLADVIIPVPIPKFFTYKVPDFARSVLKPGHRVIVQFGKKILTGLIWRVHNELPAQYEPRFILDLIDETPITSNELLQLMKWMASYYMCTIGEVMNAALPTGLKLSSESKIQLNPDFSLEESDLGFSDKELILLKALSFDKSLSYVEAAKVLDVKNIYHVLKSLIHQHAIIIYEEIRDKYIPRKEKRARINHDILEEDGKLEEIFINLEKNPKQLDILLFYLQKLPVYEDPQSNEDGIARADILKSGLSASSYNTLIKKAILEEFEMLVPRFKLPKASNYQVTLSPAQEKCQQEIRRHLTDHDVALFHGITGSGKTEVYLDLIKEQLEQGKQVLFLLPEIALTTQIVQRLMKIFGNLMGVFHSKYSDNERVEVWKGVLSGKFRFIVGVRSSIFLPFDKLGLIIIDEEHESSFKQQDPAPRYHARDAALYLAKIHQCKTILGTATPSLESYFLASQKRYGYVYLGLRYGESILPEIKLVNLRHEKKDKTLKSNFSSRLLSEIRKTIENNQQVLLFQNRRGYAPFVICDDCGWIPQCYQCSVSMTYHLYQDELVCHYCGHRMFIPPTCHGCGSTRLRTVGFGTEKIEEDLNIYLPEAKLTRMDLDTTRNKYSYQEIINRFDSGETEVLIGTQMISKGLDFGKVALVGIMDADRMLNFPDFRAVEKAFQMMTQVSGRAGRRKDKGLVLIQTYKPEHPIFQKIISNDYAGMATQELEERRQFNYPPFTRLIEVIFKHKDKQVSANLSKAYFNEIRKYLRSHLILGPEQPLINKVRNEYINHILIKTERDKVNLSKLKGMLIDTSISLITSKPFRAGRIIFNVDPS